MAHEDMYISLIKKMKDYHPLPNIELVEKAYKLALSAHGNQLRKSGEPYIIHPLSVALILADLELDSESIISGILHDVVEDTTYTVDEISTMFSPEIAGIVDGVTKLDKIQYSNKLELQADNYRKMFLATAKDIRVILIKIADRLHNMQTLKYMPRQKQIDIAQETKDIYAPIAHKLGISKIRYSMEDLAFRYLEPDEYFRLAEDINLKQTERQQHINVIIKEISENLNKINLKYDIEGRPKHFYSIYKKMISKNKTLDQIHDLFAVRVLVKDQSECYMVLGIVNSIYKNINGRFKDYISNPKENMYQSLHNTLIGPKGELFEIQIRTHDMHKVSEYGIAAHWKYKQGKTGKDSKEEEKLTWLRQIMEWQKDLDDNSEFLNAIKGDFNLYEDRVYCYTPNGDMKDLCKGSTPIDFAYAIHSEVGNMMIGAKVNGRIVPFDYTLQNQDRVEIQTSKTSSGPSMDWLNIAKSTQALNKINQWFKAVNKIDNVIRGRDILEKELKKRGFVPSDVFTSKMEKYLSSKFHFKDFDSLCAGVGHGGLKDGLVINKAIEKYEIDNKSEILKKKNEELIAKYEKQKENAVSDKIKGKNTKGIIIKNLGFTVAKFSKCCGPVPGDEIVAFTTRGRGATVHRVDCVNIINMKEEEKSRILEAEWPKGVDAQYSAVIQILAEDKQGIFVMISKLFSEEKISLENLNMNKQGDDITITVILSITSAKELERIKGKLLSLDFVRSINRITT